MKSNVTSSFQNNLTMSNVCNYETRKQDLHMLGKKEKKKRKNPTSLPIVFDFSHFS